MILAQQLARPPVPPEWAAQTSFDHERGEGTLTTGPTAPIEDHAELLREFGYDPEKVAIAGTLNQWRKQQPDGTWLTSYFFKLRAKSYDLDLPALYAAARRRPRKPLAPSTTGRVTVVALSDMQIGKTGSRGGTPELIERSAEKRAKLASHLRRVKPERTILADVGDLFEGFESGGNPMFTNDLSLAQQLDVAATELYEYVSVLARHGRVDVVAVPSNHTAWRNGKQNLGRPADDLGLHVHRQVERVAKASGLDVHWHYPREYDEATILDVDGTLLGVVHGNQYAPLRAREWWAQQQHGGQPVGVADVLLTGHYHSLIVMPTGRNPYTGRAKWWLQAPTLDNGSDWYRNLKGDDSDPGLLVFDITEAGFDLQSLTVL